MSPLETPNAEPTDYPATERTRVRRANTRAHYDRETVHAVLDAGLQCAVGYVFDSAPYVTWTAYWRHGERLYWHGSSASRMIKRTQGGVPVCVSVGLLDGVVFARSGFHHTFNYRSVVAYGTAHAVTDRDEKLAALKAFTERLAPGRWDELRPPTDQELKATAVLSMPLTEVAAKVRQGGPKDDAEDMDAPVWAGYVPVGLVDGAPVTDPDSHVPTPPAYTHGLPLG
ncbi:pyridoxamine 5'-phosphate oxidase family protein [Rhodovibrio salinarum]|uniref:Pyridoxamine 5'-phosphate oxidase family protein n=1 Tax=Rhodovibrio salinarum TaxID=1087 RepID=A0A934UZY5_9PROT|nr:pyridoxamine 5'-phosphate oxidase family protein [Rhodovibrio salinarum]MBK1697016.1 pyridoxamine 5'-phosphate oxidase family protein [Rhodovibrio salinarum]